MYLQGFQLVGLVAAASAAVGLTIADKVRLSHMRIIFLSYIHIHNFIMRSCFFQVGPTELPQAVAGFHSLVGLAATLTAVGEYIQHSNGYSLSTG